MKLSVAFVMAGFAAAVSAGTISKDFVKRAGYARGPTDTQILNYALTLEYLEADFYAGGLAQFDEQCFADAGYPAYVRQRVVEVGAQEATHVATLAGALGKAGVQKCQYTFPYTDVNSFLALASVLEGVGVSAYLGAAPDISSKAYLGVAASIVTVEARHSSELAVFQGEDGSPSPFDTPLGFSEVYTLAAPFFKSCPKGNAAKLPALQAFPALSYSGTPCPGSVLTFKFKWMKGCNKYYAHFLNGLSDTVVKLNNNKAQVPSVAGRVYVVITNSPTLVDKSVVAGPILFDVQTPSAH